MNGRCQSQTEARKLLEGPEALKEVELGEKKIRGVDVALKAQWTEAKAAKWESAVNLKLLSRKGNK